MKRNIAIIVLIFLAPLALGFGLGYIVLPHKGNTVQSQQAEVFMPVSQQEKKSDNTSADLSAGRRNAITEAVAKISPAVVGINVTEIQEQRGPFGNDPYFRRFFENDPFWNQFFNRKYEVRGLGSGFIISPDGYIVTNDHVAGNATKITITLVGGKRMDAELVGTDPLTDISLLKVKGSSLPYVNIGNSDDIVVGEWAIAFGNPFGLFEINDKPTVTVGVISSVSMNLGQIGEHVYGDMIETDAAINSGNSGGPLANAMGEVIGMNTLIYTGGQGNTFVGYGFAIPINRVKNIVNELKKHGKVTRQVNLGFEAQKVDARIARYFGLTSVQGVIVSEIQNGSSAEKAGLKVGDIILEVNKRRVNSEEELFVILSEGKAGESFDLTVVRERKIISVKMQAGK